MGYRLKKKLEGIPGCAFTSTGSMHGGQEITLMNLLTYQLHQGMIIVWSMKKS